MHWGPTWPFELGPRTIGSCVQVIQGLSVHLKDSASVNVAEGNKFEYIDFCNEAQIQLCQRVGTATKGTYFQGVIISRHARAVFHCLAYITCRFPSTIPPVQGLSLKMSRSFHPFFSKTWPSISTL